MKNQLLPLVKLLFIFFILFGCSKKSDPVNEELSINGILQNEAIPYQTVDISGSQFSGSLEDYKVIFGGQEVSVETVQTDNITFVIPLNANLGTNSVSLNYQDINYNIGEIEVLDYKNIFPENTAAISTDDDNYPYVIIDSSNTVIVPHIIEGKLQDFTLRLTDGTETFVEVNELGLPKHLYRDNINILLDGYDLENFTVNIGYYLNNEIEDIKFHYGIELNPELFEEYRTYNTTTKRSNTESALQGLGIGLGVLGCTASIIAMTTGVGAPVGILGASYTCGSALYDIYKAINPENNSEVADYALGFTGIKMNMIGCLDRPTAAGILQAMTTCGGLLVDAAKAANIAHENYASQFQNEIEQFRSILSTGFGDIKITLSWDTEADIDLWVTDPNNEKIWYENPQSASGGTLDRDDTDGYGAENIYWPVNESPFGTYIVQIHYFGPEDGPTTNCTIRIKNFGNENVYRQALTPDGLATIAIFEAGEQHRINFQKVKIDKISSGLLPKKKLGFSE